MKQSIDKNIIKQVLLVVLILFLATTILLKLKYFIPGAMGAVTLYILLRHRYFYLVEYRKWKPWLVATLMIVFLILAMALPIYGLVAILKPMVENVLANTNSIQTSVTHTIEYLNEQFPVLELSAQDISSYLQQALSYLPRVLQSMASMLANIITALFILYFMFVGGRRMEMTISKNIPLKPNNRIGLWRDTKTLVISNALGIPFLAAAQGIVAIVGYMIFGIENAILWGVITGVTTVIPIIGTMIVWIPISIYLLAIGDLGGSIGMFIYGFFAIGGVDNVLRFVFVKKFGDVHPLITVFGVILGLELFGLMGLIFGPIMISYVLLLFKIYINEFKAEVET